MVLKSWCAQGRLEEKRIEELINGLHQEKSLNLFSYSAEAGTEEFNLS
jgi:hypothetical protein